MASPDDDSRHDSHVEPFKQSVPISPDMSFFTTPKQPSSFALLKRLEPLPAHINSPEDLVKRYKPSPAKPTPPPKWHPSYQQKQVSSEQEDHHTHSTTLASSSIQASKSTTSPSNPDPTAPPPRFVPYKSCDILFSSLTNVVYGLDPISAAPIAHVIRENLDDQQIHDFLNAYSTARDLPRPLNAKDKQVSDECKRLIREEMEKAKIIYSLRLRDFGMEDVDVVCRGKEATVENYMKWRDVIEASGGQVYHIWPRQWNVEFIRISIIVKSRVLKKLLPVRRRARIGVTVITNTPYAPNYIIITPPEPEPIASPGITSSHVEPALPGESSTVYTQRIGRSNSIYALESERRHSRVQPYPGDKWSNIKGKAFTTFEVPEDDDWWQTDAQRHIDYIAKSEEERMAGGTKAPVTQATLSNHPLRSLMMEDAIDRLAGVSIAGMQPKMRRDGKLCWVPWEEEEVPRASLLGNKKGLVEENLPRVRPGPPRHGDRPASQLRRIGRSLNLVALGEGERRREATMVRYAKNGDGDCAIASTSSSSISPQSPSPPAGREEEKEGRGGLGKPDGREKPCKSEGDVGAVGAASPWKLWLGLGAKSL